MLTNIRPEGAVTVRVIEDHYDRNAVPHPVFQVRGISPKHVSRFTFFSEPTLSRLYLQGEKPPRGSSVRYNLHLGINAKVCFWLPAKDPAKIRFELKLDSSYPGKGNRIILVLTAQ